MRRCLSWIADYGLRDGFVSYVDRSGSGLTNQGWKDSHDGIQFRDGRIADAPIALCEVQGYAYEAAMGGAALLDAFGRPEGDRWRELALGLARRFRQRFWVEDATGAYPAVALDADGVAVDSLTSNIGHLLATGLLDSEERELVAARLASDELDSGFGLRTLARSSAGFNPLGYHTGSVWPHDPAIVLTGLAASPGAAAAARAAPSPVEGLLAAAEGFSCRMPELYGGTPRTGGAPPLAYPAACRPQAWSAASSVAVLAELVGLHADVPGGSVRLAPLAAAGRIAVEGLHVAGEPVAVAVGPGGAGRLSGVPSGLAVSLPSPGALPVAAS